MPTFKCSLIFLLFSWSSGLAATTVNIPLHIDYQLLKQYIIMELFSGENASAEIINDPTECSHVYLSDPKFSDKQHKLQTRIKVRANLGMGLFGQCIPFLDWTGYALILSEPVLDADKPSIRLQVKESNLYSDNNELLSSGQVWTFFKQQIHPFFNRFKIDLTPSINEIKSFLPLILPGHSQDQISDMLDSLRIANLDIKESGIDTQLVLELAQVHKIEKPETVLSEQEQQQWQRKWQSMDAFLTFMIKQLAAATESAELREALFEILLNTRYSLQLAISENHDEDFVRQWFISSWEQLAPVLRKISQQNPQYNSLSMMTLVTATDALETLDQLGPSFGLDISVDGLRRLARLVNKSPEIDPLKYEEAIDPELLRLFMPRQNDGLLLNFDIWPIQSAFAKSKVLTIKQWLPKDNELSQYLPKVKNLLLNQANKTLVSEKLSASQEKVFRQLVLATGLQESCWIQYVVNRKKIVPLRSPSGDTGIMQINERVWRGFFNVQKLRWDIAYNAKSGAKILLKYFKNYALKKAEHKFAGGIDNLALSSYSAYNGGPGYFSRYRKKATKADQAFKKKFLAVKQNREFSVSECFSDNVAKQSQVKAHKKLKHIKSISWIKQQQANHFALQLGVFSTEKAARQFIKANKNVGTFAIFHFRKGGKSYHPVLYGTYPTRQLATADIKKFSPVIPWIRSFSDILKLTGNI